MTAPDRFRGKAVAHPSLAMVKYWGKSDSIRNLPATPSLALTLGEFSSTTRVSLRPASSTEKPRDRVSVNGSLQAADRFQSFFASLRELVRRRGGAIDPDDCVIDAESDSNFPIAAGLASSASGFAALACASAEAFGLEVSTEDVSALARIGSASAARSIWGGFVMLDAGAEYAEQIHDESWWPDIRVVVARTSDRQKAVSSRMAMELCRTTSPYYDAWLQDAPTLMNQAREALDARNLPALGPVIRMSYLRMFSTMLSADPPILYWNDRSTAAIRMCDDLRSDGLSAWETMDAGPQVKVFCPKDEARIIADRLESIPGVETSICSPGPSAGPVSS